MNRYTTVLTVALLQFASTFVFANDPSTNQSPANLVCKVTDQKSGIIVGALPDRESLEAWWDGESNSPKKLWWTWARGPFTNDQSKPKIKTISIQKNVIHVILEDAETVLLELRTGRKVNKESAEQSPAGDRLKAPPEE